MKLQITNMSVRVGSSTLLAKRHNKTEIVTKRRGLISDLQSDLNDCTIEVRFNGFIIVGKITLLRLYSNYEGPAKSSVTGFGLLQCYVLSNIFLLQTFKVFPLY